MKKIATIIVLVFAYTLTTQAQKKGRKPSVEQMLKKITKELDLTSAQQNKIKPLLKAQLADRKAMNEKRKAMRESGEKPTKQMRIQLRKDRLKKETEMHTQMANILDKEQFAKFEALAKAKKENAKKKRLKD